MLQSFQLPKRKNGLTNTWHVSMYEPGGSIYRDLDKPKVCKITKLIMAGDVGHVCRESVPLSKANGLMSTTITTLSVHCRHRFSAFHWHGRWSMHQQMLWLVMLYQTNCWNGFCTILCKVWIPNTEYLFHSGNVLTTIQRLLPPWAFHYNCLDTEHYYTSNFVTALIGPEKKLIASFRDLTSAFNSLIWKLGDLFRRAVRLPEPAPLQLRTCTLSKILNVSNALVGRGGYS